MVKRLVDEPRSRRGLRFLSLSLSLSVEPLTDLMVEHLKVMAASRACLRILSLGVEYLKVLISH
jgi:hypothetical protein